MSDAKDPNEDAEEQSIIYCRNKFYERNVFLNETNGAARGTLHFILICQV